MNKIIDKLSYLIVMLFVLGQAAVAKAALRDQILGNLDDSSGGLSGGDIATLIARLIQGVLGIVVVVFFIIIVIAGFKWMTSDGNEETISKAKKTIQAGIIGTFVVMLAYAITVFIFNVVLSSTNPVATP